MAEISLRAAKEAAAKVNAMLVATGQLRPADLNKGRVKQGKSTDLFVEEVIINDAPMSARNFLTRSSTQEEISKMSGASVSTRGRYLNQEEIDSNCTSDRPLFLHIQGVNQQDVKVAVGRIMHLIMEHTHRSNNSHGHHGSSLETHLSEDEEQDDAETMDIATGEGVCEPQIPFTPNLLREKVFLPMNVSMNPVEVRLRLMGENASNLSYIQNDTGASILMRGIGSGFMEANTGQEAQEPLHFYIEHSNSNKFLEAKELVVNLAQTILSQLLDEQKARENALAAVAPPQLLHPQPMQQHQHAALLSTPHPSNVTINGAAVVGPPTMMSTHVVAASVGPGASVLQLPVGIAPVAMPPSSVAGFPLATEVPHLLHISSSLASSVAPQLMSVTHVAATEEPRLINFTTTPQALVQPPQQQHQPPPHLPETLLAPPPPIGQPPPNSIGQVIGVQPPASLSAQFAEVPPSWAPEVPPPVPAPLVPQHHLIHRVAPPPTNTGFVQIGPPPSSLEPLAAPLREQERDGEVALHDIDNDAQTGLRTMSIAASFGNNPALFAGGFVQQDSGGISQQDLLLGSSSALSFHQELANQGLWDGARKVPSPTSYPEAKRPRSFKPQGEFPRPNVDLQRDIAPTERSDFYRNLPPPSVRFDKPLRPPTADTRPWPWAAGHQVPPPLGPPPNAPLLGPRPPKTFESPWESGIPGVPVNRSPSNAPPDFQPQRMGGNHWRQF